MTPCEKLGYKVGDKFEVLSERFFFNRKETVELLRDDGTSNPFFTNSRSDVEYPNGVAMFLKDVKPLTTSKLRPAKQALADAIHASGKGWPYGAKFSAQDKSPKEICFYANDQPKRPGAGETAWRSPVGTGFMCEMSLSADRTPPNWHQTVLSRDEYFSAYPAGKYDTGVIEQNPVVEPEYCELATRSIPEPPTKPTIEQLAADYRNKLDYANRKQQDADDAKAAADAALGELVSAGEALGLVIGIAKPEPELVITDWRDLRDGDIVEIIASANKQWEQHRGQELVVKIKGCEQEDIEFGTWCMSDNTDWKFIRRP